MAKINTEFKLYVLGINICGYASYFLFYIKNHHIFQIQRVRLPEFV